MMSAHEQNGTMARIAVLATLATLTALLALAAHAAPASAQGWIEPLPRATDWGVVRVGTDVTVNVEGRVAEVVVEEWFENRGGGLGEGDYIYPLPGEAVFSSFSLYQGDEELRGETMDADRARQIYEEIVRRRRDPALIEMVGHGLVRARVFPFQPGERRRITLRYTQVLERAGDAVQFRYAAAGRTAPGVVQGPDRPVTHRPRPAPVEDDLPVSFTLTADAGLYGDPFSPTHELDVERRDGRLRVRPADALDGDLSVFLPVTEDAIGITLATHRPVGEDGYFMLTLSPGQAERETAAPRDVTAVVDVSGSMSGAKIQQTRAALHQLLGSLGPDDRFRLVSFSNRVAVQDDGWTRATPGALRDARRWVDALRAEGGTNIAGALEEALRLESPEERLPIIVFLTDGLPTVGESNPERIAAAAEAGRGRARVFAFGVGYDVNTYLLDRLGAAGRGSTEYVEPGEDVERALAGLAARITHPVLTDLRIDGAPVRLTEVYPGELPDLFAGEELVVFGRWEGEGQGDVRIAGRRSGDVERYAADQVAFPARAAANDFIPRLWASRKLGELTRQIRLNGADPELVEEVRRTALRYGLLSEFTSYLVQEPGMLADDGARIQSLPTPPPAPGRSRTTSGADVTGAAAVRASERSKARLSVASAADLDRAEREAVEEMGGAAAGPNATPVRVVAGRTFRLESGIWNQVSGRAAPDTTPDTTVTIAPFSDAYFALLAALPELRPVVTALSPVMVIGDDVRIRIHDDGVASLGRREVRSLVTAFRGR